MSELKISLGQYSIAGKKPINQDCHGAILPLQPALNEKGICVAIADGISSSEVSQEASATSIKSFFNDYYTTPASWSVKTSATRVLQAVNSWLYAQNRNSRYRYNLDRGYVCTFSALLLKSHKAHLFHVGDARIYRLAGNSLETLTRDHRVQVSPEKNYLSNALGMRDYLDVDYQQQPVAVGDTFILATDGVYEFIDTQRIADIAKRAGDDFNQAAQLIVEEALCNGSDDNLSIQIVRIDQLPTQQLAELQEHANLLAFPPLLEARQQFEGFTILRQLHSSSRSHIFLARDNDSGQQVVIKTPSHSERDNSSYIENFLKEEWIAKRICHPNLLRSFATKRQRNSLYLVNEYIEGHSLAQLTRDSAPVDLNRVRGIVAQVAKGLRALHKKEMLHQDLRPNNIMIDGNDTVTIIDFGAVRVAGLEENRPQYNNEILGTLQFTAPEYFTGTHIDARADQFSLGVITYQMLTGQLPYGLGIAKAHSRAEFNRAIYQPARNLNPEIPNWVDEALRKATQINPNKRYEDISEFVYDLSHPNPSFIRHTLPPLIERNPLRFWKSLSAILTILCLILLVDKLQPFLP